MLLVRANEISSNETLDYVLTLLLVAGHFALFVFQPRLFEQMLNKVYKVFNSRRPTL